MKSNILLTPGPVKTTSKVKQALIVPDICPREKEFQNIIKGIRTNLVSIANGDKNYTCILLSGSGTAAMEACMNSVMDKENNYALIISNGAYGDRFTTIATKLGIKTIVISEPYGKRINIKRIKKVLENVPNVGAVFVVHHETTTGVLNDIKKIGEAVKFYDVPYVVDTISSFAGMPISIKDIQADFIIATSNKCLQGLPGVSFVIAKKKTLEKCKGNSTSLYLDLYEQWKYLEETGQFRFTAPVQIIYALWAAIDELANETLFVRYHRYEENWETLVEGMDRLGFKSFKHNSQQSTFLTTYYEPNHPNWDFDLFHDKLYSMGYTIYPGKLTKEKTFRLANIGNICKKDIKTFLLAVDIVLKEMKVQL